MAKTPQHEWQPTIPDYQMAEIRKKILDILKESPPRAERMATMLELCRAGASPDNAARATLLFDNWDEDEDFRKAVEAACAQHIVGFETAVGHKLRSSPMGTPSIANSFARAKAGWNEKAGEGWHQNIKVLPVVKESKFREFSPNQDYAAMLQADLDAKQLEADQGDALSEENSGETVATK